MIDITKKNILQLKKDFIIFTLFLVVADIVQAKILNTPLFSNTWINIVIGTYMGLVLYDLILHKLTHYITSKLNTKKYFDSYEDVIKYLTVIICQYICVTFSEGGIINFDNEWLITAVITLLCYTVFILVEAQIIPDIKNNNDQILLNNLIKIGASILIYSYFITGPINSEPLLAVLPFYIAFGSFHLFNILLSPIMIQ